MSLVSIPFLHRFNTVSARIFTILLLGVIGATSLTVWLAFGERQTIISHERNSFRSERLKHSENFIRAINSLPSANRADFLKIVPRFGLQLATRPQIPEEYEPTSAFAIALRDRLRKDFKVYALTADEANCNWGGDFEQHEIERCEALLIVLSDGVVLRQSIFPFHNAPPPVRRETIFYLLLFISCLAALALFVSRITIRPLQQLAQAAKNLGQDINHPPLPEQGAKEILQATRAFNAMQTRIRAHIQQRTQMLAAITHDLQTPLTRLRLRLEKVSDAELQRKLIEDLSNMQIMIKEGLDLARSIDSTEELRPLDLDSLLDSMCSDALDAGHDVHLEGLCKATIMARPQTLRRCLNNLIDNALKYGARAALQVQVVVDSHGKWVSIRIRDAGQGIPEDQLTRVFEPFYRVESSRSRETGGTGLGLTIALNIAEQHNGRLTLKNHTEGGLEACLVLPVID